MLRIMIDFEKKIEQLKKYFLEKTSVMMAYVFGSYAKGREMSESDFDVAVYFKPENNQVEYEEQKKYREEDKIWNDVEKIIGVNTDFIVLNRAKVTLADEIVQTGIPLVIKDRLLYIDFLLIITREAENFREFIKDFWAIEQRSASLFERDKVRLIERIKFLANELSDIIEYKSMNLEVYREDRMKRRSVERWIENIANASIDVTKILLASEKKRIPDKYKDILLELATFEGFDRDVASKLAEFSKLRNILAHEYLDIRFEKIKEFLEKAEPAYKNLIDFVNKLL